MDVRISGIPLSGAPDRIGAMSDWLLDPSWSAWYVDWCVYHGHSWSVRRRVRRDWPGVPSPMIVWTDHGFMFRLIPRVAVDGRTVKPVWNVGPYTLTLHGKGVFWPESVIKHDSGFTEQSTFPEAARWLASEPVQGWISEAEVYHGALQAPGFIGQIHFPRKTL